MSLSKAVPPPPRHRTAKDYVYDSLSQALREGQIRPGTHLSEKDISEWLQVSRTPVREALSALEGDGLVDLVPHRGAVVRTVTATEIREEYTVRAALESLAIELAVPRIPDEVLQELVAMVDDMHGAVDADLHEYLERNKQLHLRLYEFCGSARLVSMIESSWDKENYFRNFYFALSEGPAHEEQMHHALLDACLRRDPTAARDLVKNSLLEAAEMLADQFDKRDQQVAADETSPDPGKDS